MEPDRWDRLGWHHQRALIEGLEDEGLISGGDAAPDDSLHDLTSATDAELGGLGWQVESV